MLVCSYACDIVEGAMNRRAYDWVAANLLRTEFRQTLGSEGAHILDPFTGTGTFITIRARRSH